MSEPFVLSPADIDQPYRRWQLIRSLVEEGDTVEVEFFTDSNSTYRIAGTYCGIQRTVVSHASVNDGDHNAIIVVATSFHRRSKVGNLEATWPGGTCTDTPYVVATKNIVRIENIDGPVRGEIDEERLRDAIYHAIADRIGPTAEVAPGIITDIIRNYERD